MELLELIEDELSHAKKERDYFESQMVVSDNKILCEFKVALYKNQISFLRKYLRKRKF